MGTIGVNPPKTPVTKGSNGIAMATVPNVCKMPGPPAPFVPVPLPNIGKSDDSPKDYSKTVKFESQPVAIKGATFNSKGDIASKGTGGGLISANTHGPTKFVAPGSMDVKVEGKNVQLLGDQMLNNCAGGGSPNNSATLAGVLQGLVPAVLAFAEQMEQATTECRRTGGHRWTVEPASGTRSLKEKISDMNASTARGARFEGKAATHNMESKDLRTSSQLSGSNNDPEDKVRSRCTVEGCPMSNNPREIDQLHDDPKGGPPWIVEVKSKTSLDDRDMRQLARNMATVAQGQASGITYKVPKSGGAIQRQLEGLSRQLKVPIQVIKI